MSETHTVFGAGQVGTLLAKQLAEQGHAVRLVRRGEAGEAIDGVTWMRGDATDAQFADKACEGATVVYNCANPPDYARWEGVLEPLYRSVWRAAGRSGARLVQLDNLYMYGRPAQAPFDESTPMQPCSKKGELRRRLADELFDMHARGEVVATAGRASDFFGPDTPRAMVLRPDVYDRIRAGSTVYVFGDPDTPHSYSYTPDVARGLATLGANERAFGRVWHLPVSAQLSTREVIDRFAARCGTTVKVRQVPRFALRILAAFWPLMEAISEMNYQWDIPYLVDDTAFRTTFDKDATPLDQAIGETLTAHAA